MKKTAILALSWGFILILLTGIWFYGHQKNTPAHVEKALQNATYNMVNITTDDWTNNDIEDYEESPFPELEILISQSDEHSQGSGVILNNPRCILTNYHVISKAKEITVHFSDGRQEKATLLGYDKDMELAVLSISRQDIKGLDLNLTPSTFAQPVYILGFPYNLGLTVTQGLMAGHPQPLKSPFIMINALINPGTSGGAVLSQTGDLIALAIGSYQDNDLNRNTGIALAIPSHLIEQALQKIPHQINHVEPN